MSYRRNTGRPRAPDRRSVPAADAQEWTACRPAPSERWRWRAHRHSFQLGRHVRLRRIGLQIGQLQLELVMQPTPFRGLAEPIMSELPDRELELLDQQCPVLCLALRRRGSQAHARSQDRLEANHQGSSPTMESQADALANAQPYRDPQCRNQPAARGRQVFCGIRQSMPFSRCPAAPMRSSRRRRSATAR
jgi:hypothetical protein